MNSRRAVSRIFLCCLMGIVGSLYGCANAADPGRLTVHLDRPGVKISPMLYGLMTEEINHSYDGGLYGELIQNRAFADPPVAPPALPKSKGTPAAVEPPHWFVVTSGDPVGGGFNVPRASMALDFMDPVNEIALKNSLRLTIEAVSTGQRAGVGNDGYWGIPVRPNTEYRASFYAKAAADFKGPLMVDIEANNGTVAASATVPEVGTAWKKYTVTLKTDGRVMPSANNRFVISGTSKGTIWLSLVSLFPPTFNDRPNGNRIDLMQKLADMQPAFLRFPGGNYVEGNEVNERFEWRDTLGPLEDRPGHWCPWGYRSTDGMGLLEFLEWCEDCKMEPVLAVWAGYALRGNYIAKGPALQPYVDDALDEIEYVTGDTSTRWGAQRAKDGHPAPFKLTYVEVGNEDFFDQSGNYEGRFSQFHDAIKAKYPQLKLIATAPVKSSTPDAVDDHYYRSAREMELDVHHYDKSDRNGPKIFVGEWASTEGSPTPTMNAALGDAAWLTGLERNSDLIVMSCYAPLLVNVNQGASQWGTNLIGYDALNSFGSPSYYVQKMFNHNRGDTVIPVEVAAAPVKVAEGPPPHGGIGVGTWSTDSEYRDIKVTAPDGKVLFQPDLSKGMQPWKTVHGTWVVENGAVHQTSDQTDCRATIGDASWKDYTLTMKARKHSGNEGFLILFHAHGDDYLWWNIGGWGNTRTIVERAENGAKGELGTANTDIKVEDNRWYDIRLEVRGRDIKGYLDGKLVTQTTDESLKQPDPVYATASRVDASGEVIVKVVNVSDVTQPLELNLEGVNSVAPNATLEVISGEPGEMNSIQEPQKVAPREETISNASTKFTHEFPAHSVSVLRFKPQ